MTKPKPKEPDAVPPPKSVREPIAVSSDVQTDGWLEFHRRYERPFARDIGASAPQGTCFLLSFVAAAAYDTDGDAVVPVSMKSLMEDFTAPLPGEPPYTEAMGDLVLSYLVEKQMVEVDGDVVSVHRSFTRPVAAAPSLRLAEAAD